MPDSKPPLVPLRSSIPANVESGVKVIGGAIQAKALELSTITAGCLKEAVSSTHSPPNLPIGA